MIKNNNECLFFPDPSKIDKDVLKKAVQKEIQKFMAEWTETIINGDVDDIFENDEIYKQVIEDYNFNHLPALREFSQYIIYLSCDMMLELFKECCYQKDYLKLKEAVLKEV